MRSADQKLPVQTVGSFKNNVKPMPNGAWASAGYEGSYPQGQEPYCSKASTGIGLCNAMFLVTLVWNKPPQRP